MQKVKEFCMKSEPDKDGDYVLRFDGQWQGFPVEYIMAYFPDFGITGIGLVNESGSYVIQFQESTRTFSIYSNGATFMIDEKLAIERAFMIFRELVLAKIV